MERRRLLARWLVVAALACFGFTGLLSAAQAQEGETTVQGSQSSTDAEADTGSATGSNTNTLQGGPSSSGTTAGANQIGSNRATVSQTGSAKSGDPVAGAQVTGAVADNVTVQNQNASTDASATSGTATLTNDADVALGPTATTTGGTAQAAQTGSNSVDIAQAGLAITGDAVAGSQVTGIVGGGEHVIQNQNTSTCDTFTVTPGSIDPRQVPFQCALSGAATVTNTASMDLGPFADTGGLASAQAGQIGHNDAVLSQSAGAHTGDALEGSQVAGIVGGSATVQQQNSSDLSGTGSGGAASGTASAANVAGDTDLTPDSLVANVGPFANGAPSQASQNGDNAVDVAQDATGSSGDALNGSQVTGGVGDQGGFFTVQNQQASESDLSVSAARSGDVIVANSRLTVVGPLAISNIDREGGADAQASQVGDNSVTSWQNANGSTGDALAGAQVTGAVGYTDVTVQNQNVSDLVTASSGSVFGGVDFAQSSFAGNVGIDIVGPAAAATSFSDDTTAQASQNGDNVVDATQALTATTGDAVGGGQVTGVVATDGANVTIQNQNDANEPGAESGSVLIEVGNFYISEIGPISSGSQASQIGDSILAVDQSFVAATGDVVAGSQVTGVVAGDNSDITIQNQNHSALSEPVRSGSVAFTAGNLLLGLTQGPTALGEDAQATHNGDTVADLSQTLDVSTGDALAGAQVTGTVAGDSSTTTIQNQNNSDTDSAFSGAILGDVGNAAVNTATAAESLGEFIVTPLSLAFAGGVAQSSQIGDNLVSLDQSLAASTGDAVAGSQVTGSVTGADSEVTVQNQNFADAALATSGDVAFEFFANAAGLEAGPVAISDSEDGTAQASQNGDNAVDVVQTLDISTGDAVAGSQVTGAVAGPGSDVTVQNQNVATAGTIATSGSVVGAENLLFANLGPQASADGSAQAEQIGDNWLTFVQDASVSSGDAVGGSQVTGIVGPEDATVQVQNTADEPDAISGTVDGVNTANGALTAQAESFSAEASAQQNGDSGFDGVQNLATGSGDAVAGAQVSGIVGAAEVSAHDGIAGVAAAA